MQDTTYTRTRPEILVVLSARLSRSTLTPTHRPRTMLGESVGDGTLAAAHLFLQVQGWTFQDSTRISDERFPRPLQRRQRLPKLLWLNEHCYDDLCLGFLLVRIDCLLRLERIRLPSPTDTLVIIDSSFRFFPSRHPFYERDTFAYHCLNSLALDPYFVRVS